MKTSSLVDWTPGFLAFPLTGIVGKKHIHMHICSHTLSVLFLYRYRLIQPHIPTIQRICASFIQGGTYGREGGPGGWTHRSHLLCWEEFMLSLVSFFPFSLILSQIFPVIMRWWQITDPPIKTKWCSTWHPMLLTKVSSCICHLFSKVQRQLKYQNGKCSVHRSELKALVNQI